MGSVLIIDAEEDFAGQLAQALRSNGLEPTVTADGKSGLDMAHINIPEAIVLCVELPGMSGYSICTKLKKDATLKSVPLIITSAEATQETFEHHKKLKTRAEEYLKKPFPPSELVEVLGRYVALGASNGASEEIISEDLSIDADVPPATLPDDEAFSGEEFPIEEPSPPPPQLRGRSGGAALDQAISALASDGHLLSGAGMSDDLEEEEALTTVGVVPMGVREGAATSAELAELRVQLRNEQEARARAERDRDQALANERAVQAQVQSLSQSQLPSATSQAPSASREVLALKKEVNVKDHEILELKDRLQTKEKQLLAMRDRENELEGQVVAGEERIEILEREKVDLHGRVAASDARSAELQRSADAQISDLNQRLGQASAHEAELDGALASMTAEADGLRGQLEQKSAQGEQLSLQVRALTSELTRVSNQLSAANAEAEDLRAQLRQTQDTLAQVQRAREGLESDLESTRQELQATRAGLADAEDRISQAFERIHDHEKAGAQIRKALEYSLKLLPEEAPDPQSVDVELG
ncbi:MAG: response regulator [Deltaproteobacteria bacterium]|jgi:CheY-like chemotaxis protein|nr:response regulator [Deltaproteobacteria bacterium]